MYLAAQETSILEIFVQTFTFLWRCGGLTSPHQDVCLEEGSCQQTSCYLQFDIIMLDVAAPDPDGDPGSLHSVLSHFLSPPNIQEGLQRRLRLVTTLSCLPLRMVLLPKACPRQLALFCTCLLSSCLHVKL